MTTRADIIAEARRWIGTPWRHQGRVLGRSCDCIGLVIGVGRALGLGDYRGSYPRHPDPAMMQAGLAEHLDPVDEPQPGDVLYITFAGAGIHLGIMSAPGRIIHAYQPRGEVTEHGLDAKWRRRIASAWAYRGID